MSDSVTRFTIEHSEKERMVQLEVTDIKAKTKHIEKLIKENHPDWLVIKKCSQLKDRLNYKVQSNEHQPPTLHS